jgi:hypothetical protein
MLDSWCCKRTRDDKGTIAEAAAACSNACSCICAAAHPQHSAHLGKCAGALILDLVVPNVDLHQLFVGVLLQRPGQLHAARIALQD